ncbi:hypothetical protein TKK_0009980 [Trichogramma kaykai]
MTKFGQNDTLDDNTEAIQDWNVYYERLEQYFKANFVETERKVSVLITAIGPAVYKTLRDLCHLELPSGMSYEALCEILRKQFSPWILVFKERKQFYEQQQRSGETITDWYSRVKKRAVHCEFGNDLETHIKDKFVTGMLDGKILDRVCEKSHTDALAAILETALQKEASLSKTPEDGVNNLYSQNSREHNSKNKPKQRNNTKGTSNQQHTDGASAKQKNTDSSETCNHCGGTRHDYAKCKYKSCKWNNCSKKGHLAKVCRSKNSKTHHISESNDSIGYIYLNNINCDDVVPPEKIDVLVSGKKVTMEIDSGAGVTVIPESVLKSAGINAKLQTCKRLVQNYDLSPVNIIGEFYADVTLGLAQKVRIVVSTGRHISVSFMGRSLMSKLGIHIGGIEDHIQVNNVSNKNELTCLLNKYPELFDGKLGTLKGTKIHLYLKKDAKPIFKKPHAIPFAYKELVEKELKRLEKEGIIEKNYKKRLGHSTRSYYEIKWTITIEEIFAALKGGEELTKLDLEWAYNQLELDDELSKLLAWSTHARVYKVKRLAFGPKTACSVFQEKIEEIVKDISGCKNYFDDLIVTGKNRREHLSNLEKVFQALSEKGLRLKKNKCEFLQPQVKYLGYIIDRHRLHKDPDSIKAIVKLGRPKNVSEVQSFTGMVNCYMKFIPNLSTMLSPIYQLLKKNTPFKWDEKCEKAFTDIKRELTRRAFHLAEKNLVYCDPTLRLKLYTDASNAGLGAVLMHVFPDSIEKPICFASRTLSKSERGYAEIHKEALAIYWSCKKFHQYLIGRHFDLYFDHKPLMAIFGKDNGGADGLSRLPVHSEESDEEEINFVRFIVENKLPVIFLGK